MASAKIAAPVALPVTVKPTRRYGGGFVVFWGPVVHGGVHRRSEDAQAHAEGLRAAPLCDHLAWVEAHPVVSGRGVRYVASASAPGTYYEIREGSCTCEGFRWRGHCRHLTEAGVTPSPDWVEPEYIPVKERN